MSFVLEHCETNLPGYFLLQTSTLMTPVPVVLHRLCLVNES